MEVNNLKGVTKRNHYQKQQNLHMVLLRKLKGGSEKFIYRVSFSLNENVDGSGKFIYRVSYSINENISIASCSRFPSSS